MLCKQQFNEISLDITNYISYYANNISYKEMLMGTRFFSLQDGKIAYDDLGSGPLVVCVPGMGDVRGEYRFLASQLEAAGFRVVSMDVRGHGETSPGWPDYSVGAIGNDVVSLIRYLDSGPAVIIGTSMAAGAAVWAAAEAPQNTAGLVLLGPFVRSEPTWQTNLLYSAMFSRPWGPAAWLKYYATLYPTSKPLDFDGYCAALRANLAEPGRIEALMCMLKASKGASEQRLPKVTAPVLVIMGSKDPDFKNPRAEAHWVSERLRASCHIVDGAGHYPHAEMPEMTGPLILDFLSQLEAHKAVAYAA
jgi:pimeloyl-ACP methyl ester carboxylesterase